MEKQKRSWKQTVLLIMSIISIIVAIGTFAMAILFLVKRDVVAGWFGNNIGSATFQIILLFAFIAFFMSLFFDN